MRESNEPILTFEDFALDIAAAELRKSGEPVQIEPQVFDLIVFLARNPGRVVSRDDIIEAVWSGRIVSESAISTRINAARKALGDDGSTQRVIKTIHGRGFRFELQSDVLQSETDNARKPNIVSSIDVRYCTTSDGVSLAYGSTGNGPPLVKAASFMTHLQHDTEGIIFRDWISELSKHYQYVRYDERGNGLSDWAIESFSFEAMVNDLETVVDAMNLNRFALLGVSQGASVSMEYARRHPERVGCLIIFGGYAVGWRNSEDENFRTMRDALMELTRTSWGTSNPTGRQAYAALFMPEGAPEQHAEFGRLQQITTTPDNAYRILKTFSEIDVRPVLPEITVPTLVMHCRGDAVVPFEAGRGIAAGIPDARFVVIDGNNHIIQSGDPGWARFAGEINRFMSEHMDQTEA